MRSLTTAVCIALAASQVGGCDPLWVRQSLVEVTPGSFPTCVQSVLAEAGLKPSLSTDTNGQKRLAATYLRGVLNIAPAKSPSSGVQVLELQLIGRGYQPPSEFKSQLGEGMERIGAKIAKSCADG